MVALSASLMKPIASAFVSVQVTGDVVAVVELELRLHLGANRHRDGTAWVEAAA